MKQPAAADHFRKAPAKTEEKLPLTIWLRGDNNCVRFLRTSHALGWLIGRRRNGLRQGSRLHDIIYMDALPSDFQTVEQRHESFWQGVSQAEAEYRAGLGRDYTSADELNADLGLPGKPGQA